MKKILVFFLMVLSISTAQAQDTSFAAGFEDLPVMPGLKQADESSVSFDTPAGRFIEAYLEGEEADKSKIEKFYDKTLPQLGWIRSSKKAKNANKFVYFREGEQLTFTVEGKNPVTVRIELTTN